MLKLGLCLLIVSLSQFAQAALYATSLFPTCTGTGFPNFSYAKSVQSASGSASFPCNQVNTDRPSPPVTVTWFYYENYPPLECGNSNLPDGDQCCHTTATSTLTFDSTVFVNTLLGAVGTSTGNVTAGAFLGQSATMVVTKPNLNLSCATAFGREAQTGTISLTIGNGPVCLNGAQLQENCPGNRN